MAEASLALVSVETPPTAEADGTVRVWDDVLEKWMAETNSRNLYKQTEIVDLLWKSGSGVDVNLLADPFIYALAAVVVQADPTLRPHKADLRNSLIRCHCSDKGPCLFHLGTLSEVASRIAERIMKVCGKYRFLKRDTQRMKQVCARANHIQRHRIVAIVAEVKDSVMTVALPKPHTTGSAIDDLEAFLSDVSPRSNVPSGDEASPVGHVLSMPEPLDDTEPVESAPHTRALVYDLTQQGMPPILTGQAAMAELEAQFLELAEFTGSPSNVPAQHAAHPDIAELEAHLMMVDDAAGVPTARCSRALAYFLCQE